MSKIDLFDQKWIDLVFEGKNEAYGAYQLRKNTNNRNLLAMLALIGGIAGIVALLLLWGVAKNTVFADDELTGTAEVAEFTEVDNTEEEEVVEEEEDFDVPPPPEIEEVLIEEVANSDKYTDFASEDDKEKEVVTTAEEANEGTNVTATVEFHEGSDTGTEVMDKNKEIVEEKHEAPVEEQKVFDVVEQMPQFPGGDAALMQFLSSHIKYPAVAEENGIQGRVVCTFVVERNGSISDVRVVKSVDPSLDKEAMRVIKSMPNWIPGKQNGQAVRVKYTVPVTFKLQ